MKTATDLSLMRGRSRGGITSKQIEFVRYTRRIGNGGHKSSNF